MKIGIDISQLAYKNTGVANYLSNLVTEIVKDDKNEYILLFSSLRGSLPQGFVKGLSKNSNIKIYSYKIPPSILHILWNKLHIFPIENLIGNVDIFLSSDWAEPPARKARKTTIIYDLIVYKYPEETHKKIVEVQKAKLSWVKKESDVVFCISESTKNDAKELLNIDSKRLKVIYPGLT